MPARDVLAGEPRHRRVVDAELHGERRLVDADAGKRRRIHEVQDRVADLDVGKAGDHDDVAGRGFGDLDPLDPLEHVDLAGLPLLDDRAVGPHGGELDRPRETSRKDAADRQPPEVVGVVDVGHDHLEGRLADDRRRNVRQDRVEKRLQVSRGRLRVLRGEAEAARAVEDLELEVMLLGRQRQEEVVDLLLHLERPARRPGRSC